MISETDIRNILRHRCNEVGSISQWARGNQIDPAVISHVLSGRMRPPAKVLAGIGYEKKIHYVALQPPTIVK